MGGPPHVDRGGVLVAVIDEDPWAVRSVNGVLRDVGFRTLGFSSPLAALEILVPRRFDVVITEHRMKELSGAQLSSLARERMGDERPGFVLLTRSLVSVEGNERALFDACLAKPFQVMDLVAAIEESVSARPRKSARPRPATGARWLHGTPKGKTAS
ncbi:Response regulatory domain-containing protein [Sandaracinus amylolyticus]|nr:Response regulatory domain-containing protein [Sandaracinus amylolyticus]